MPMYDFRCDEGHRFERVVPLSRFREQQACECGARAVKLISAPRVLSDAMQPTYGADGQLHDSRSSYRRSLKPEGNARGETFHELAPGEKLPDFKPPEFDRRQRRDDIRKSLIDVRDGRTPPPQVVYGDASL